MQTLQVEDTLQETNSSVSASAAGGPVNWTANAQIEKNALVVNQGSTFLCTTTHTTGSSFDPTKFSAVGGQGNITYIGIWQSNTTYPLNAVVTYGGSTWICIQAHTSGLTFNPTVWQDFSQFRGVWQPTTQYIANDVIIQSNSLWSAKTTHVSGASFSGSTNWNPLSSGATTLTGDTDVAITSPQDGQTLIFVTSTGKWTNMARPGQSSSGPGGVPGGNTTAAVTVGNPGGAQGFDQWRAVLNAAVVVLQMPALSDGLNFLMRLDQDATGNRQVQLAANPPTEFPGVQLSLIGTPNAENMFGCVCDGTKWQILPLTTAAQNLSDIPDPAQARHNIGVVSLGPAKTVYITPVTGSGTLTAPAGAAPAGNDGVSPGTGDVVFLAGQGGTPSTAHAGNGPWLVQAGPWLRLHDYFTGQVVPPGTTISIGAGTTYGGSQWTLLGLSSVTVDTTATAWTEVGATVAATSNYLNVFGDESESSGTVTLPVGGPAPAWASFASGTNFYTLSQDVHFNNLVINSGVTLVLNGYRLFVNGILTNNGTIGTQGTAGANGAAGASAAGGAGSNTNTVGGGTTGATGVVSSSTVGAQAGTKGMWGSGGTGGSNSIATVGGAAQVSDLLITNSSQIQNVLRHPAVILTGGYLFQSLSTAKVVKGGTGGSAGAGDGTNSGGGGGAGGPFVAIFAKTIINNGTIQSKGGNGGNGLGGSGSGGGGSGGIICVHTVNAITGTTGAVFDVSPGTSGTVPGGAGSGTVGSPTATSGFSLVVTLQ